ncbi:MAG: hypothetical protein JXL97_04765, partial [Bacteroidales bacterium]|nr:hypothetical protein [Bacteroidales bacterium]
MFDKLRKIIPDFSKAKVIEGIINPEVHLEYIEFSAKMVNNTNEQEIISISDNIFDEKIEIDEKKRLLVLMAKIDDVHIFRKLQKYSENPDKELSDWAFIALQESQSLIQSSLLGEEQILISTGLGGKGNKLRFFIIAQTENNEQITNIQKKIISNEIEFAFKNNDCELEKIEYGDYFYTIVGLFPFNFEIIEITLSQIFEEVKNFNINISEKYIITNVKISDLNESALLIREMEQKAKSGEFDNNEFENDLFDVDDEDFENLFDEDDFDDFNEYFDDDDDEDDDEDEDEDED